MRRHCRPASRGWELLKQVARHGRTPSGGFEMGTVEEASAAHSDTRPRRFRYSSSSRALLSRATSRAGRARARSVAIVGTLYSYSIAR
jgi:hypothetical protein